MYIMVVFSSLTIVRRISGSMSVVQLAGSGQQQAFPFFFWAPCMKAKRIIGQTTKSSTSKFHTSAEVTTGTRGLDAASTRGSRPEWSGPKRRPTSAANFFGGKGVEHLDPWYEAKSDGRSHMRCSTCYHQSEISRQWFHHCSLAARGTSWAVWLPSCWTIFNLD